MTRPCHPWRGAALPLLLLLPWLAPVPALAQEPTEPSEAILAKLEGTTVSVNFLETPLSTALAYLQEATEVPIVISSDQDPEVPVTFRASDITARRVLKWVTYLADLTWGVRESVVFVGSIDEMSPGASALAILDIRDLVAAIPDFPGPRASFGLASLEGVGSSPAVFGDYPESIPADVIVELIVSTIDPESWDLEGRAIDASNGILLVANSQEVVDQIRSLLTALRSTTTRMVSVEALYLAVSPEVWEEVLVSPDSGDARVLLDRAGYAALAARQAQGDGVRLVDRVRATCFSGQRVHTQLGGQRAYIADLDIELAQGSVAADPIVRTLRDGVMLDVRPVASASQEEVVLRLAVSLGRSAGSPRTQTYGPDDVAPGGARPDIHLPVVDGIEARTTVPVPDQGAVVLSFTSPLVPEEGWHLLAVVHPQIIQQEVQR